MTPAYKRQRRPPPQSDQDATPIVPRGITTKSFTKTLKIPISEEGRYKTHLLDITYTNSSHSADLFVEKYLGHGGAKIGFDLEHRPTYKPGQKPNVSLLQFAPFLPAAAAAAAPPPSHGTSHPVLVYAMYHDNGRIPASLIAVLSDPSIEKYGVGIHGDIKHLKYLDFSAQCKKSYIELGPLGFKKKIVDRSTVGLKALMEVTMGVGVTAYKTKKLTMTNWELPNLSPAQLKYASMDAFAAIEIYRILDEINETQDTNTLVKTDLVET